MIDPIDRDLLYFLCAAQHNHCRVRVIKAPRKAALKRLRDSGYVASDSYEPTEAVMCRWRRAFVSESPPSPGGAAGEEQPTPKAADAEGGAAARTVAAPPKPTGKAIYDLLMAQGRLLGMSQSAVSEKVFGNATQLSLMHHKAGPVQAKTWDKARVWLERQAKKNIHAASGTAREASSAGELTSAQRIEDGAAPAEPRQTTTTDPTGAHPTFPRCGHPKTLKNTRTVGRHRSAACDMCWRESLRAGQQRRQARRDAPLRPFEVEPAHYAPADKQQRANARRGAAILRTTTRKAQERIEQGLDPRTCKQASVRHAQFALEEENRQRDMLADPIEIAKAKLQRRYKPVICMGTVGGDPSLYMVGNKRNVTKDELLEMAGRMAA